MAFSADGTLYVGFVTLAGLRNEPDAAWVAVSDDGGATLSRPHRAVDGPAFQVAVAADPARPDRVYLAYLDAGAAGAWGFTEAANPIRVQRSDDGGKTWGQAVTVSAPGHVRALAPTLQVSADGAVHVAYLDLGDDRLDYHGEHEGRGGPAYDDGHWSLTLARSSDGGDTWEHTSVDDDLVPAERIIAFFAPRPSLAVAGDDVHVAFHDARRSPADVWLWTSPDRGVTFAEPVLVNDTEPDDATAQYRPALGVATDGRLDVVYYDRREDPDNVFNHVSVQSSDDGEDFSPAVRLSDEAFDSRVGDGSERNLADLGSRLALASDPDRAVAVWTDTRAGTRASGKQDLAVARVAFFPAAAWRGPVGILGAAVTALGFAVTLRWAIRRRQRRPWSARTRARSPAVR